MMVVDDFDNDCICDCFPDIASIGIDWNGMGFGSHDQSIGLVEVKSPLTFTVGTQFMKVSWDIAKFFKIRCGQDGCNA